MSGMKKPPGEPWSAVSVTNTSTRKVPYSAVWSLAAITTLLGAKNMPIQMIAAEMRKRTRAVLNSP